MLQANNTNQTTDIADPSATYATFPLALVVQPDHKLYALFGHEYGMPIADAEWKRQQTTWNMEQYLRNFYSSEFFAKLKRLPRGMWL